MAAIPTIGWSRTNPDASPSNGASPYANSRPNAVRIEYPAPSAELVIATVRHSVAGERQGGGGGAGTAGVQQATVCSAVPSSSAFVVVQLGSTCHGGTHATTRQMIRPMQATSWLHCP